MNNQIFIRINQNAFNSYFIGLSFSFIFYRSNKLFVITLLKILAYFIRNYFSSLFILLKIVNEFKKYSSLKNFSLDVKELYKIFFLLVNQTGFRSGIGPPPATSFTGLYSEIVELNVIFNR